MGEDEGTKDTVANYQSCEANMWEEVSAEYLDAGFDLHQSTVSLGLSESEKSYLREGAACLFLFVIHRNTFSKNI